MCTRIPNKKKKKTHTPSAQFLTDPLDLRGTTIESKSISIEILTFRLDLEGKSVESNMISIDVLAYLPVERKVGKEISTRRQLAGFFQRMTCPSL